MFHFREANLLQKRHDKITDKFIQCDITWKDYERYEKSYLEIKHLYTINLN